MQISTKYHEKTNIFHQSVAKEKRISLKKKTREIYQKAIENAHFNRGLRKTHILSKSCRKTEFRQKITKRYKLRGRTIERIMNFVNIPRKKCECSPRAAE